MGNQQALMGHERAAATLRDQYAALPHGTPVRLAKSTSNLFRFRDPATRTLDVSRFAGVLSVDAEARTADVGGMTTYEDLVDATLPYGLMPLVVPQLKTITLGGAVAGLGIESTSFRNGLPHESVLEMEILTGDGRIVRLARGDELFRGFPNSYGTFGYALRLKIELEPVSPYVELRHVRFDDPAVIAEHTDADFLDGTVFGPGEQYLTIGRFVDKPTFRPSDYTGQDIFYKSIRERTADLLTIRDYLWRWDTDWFWCSRAFGAQIPWVRRLWPKKYLRSDVYRKLVALDRRYGVTSRARRIKGAPDREPVIQDVEIPLGRVGEFLEFFHRDIGISPVWLCPIKLRDAQTWPLYPMDPDTLYVNVGFWATVPLRPGQRPGHHNRLIEQVVTDLGGHKSLYSESFYSREDFWRLYDGERYRDLKLQFDPDGRLPDLYDKCVRGS
ncbi:FAD-binding oxidoreductase [Kibdelosporangium persicum]|uniref:Delta(24)-sterol reductase n=1 Tax=Kibdelosporangium persicum TaxID=2698649 RepID=A0ABX2FFU3_9PSEU|nr:FAD-binding oxidoreductase [Kibdelosporangium persicum]NRN70253.1 FAD-binding oxidoreductase [Kibdelosporangium persicum]